MITTIVGLPSFKCFLSVMNLKVSSLADSIPGTAMLWEDVAQYCLKYPSKIKITIIFIIFSDTSDVTVR